MLQIADDLTDVRGAVSRLRDLSTDAQNLAGGAHGVRTEAWRNSYMVWVDKAELQLRSIFGRRTEREQLYTGHYWRIVTYDPIDEVPRLVQAELRHQLDWLRRLELRLVNLADRLDAAPGHFAIADTHMLLHYQPMPQIPWPRLLSKPKVRIALPLRVVQELDDLKWVHRDERIRSRARSVTAMLRRKLAPLGGAPQRLADNVTIEILVDDEPVERAVDADSDVLAAAVQLHALTRPVTLLTGDAGMATQAGVFGIPTYEPPKEYLRDRDDVDHGYDDL